MAAAVIGGKIITLSPQEIRKIPSKQSNLIPKQQEKEEQSLEVSLVQFSSVAQLCLTLSRRKEIIKIRAEINQIEIKKIMAKINETKSWLFKKIKLLNC